MSRTTTAPRDEQPAAGPWRAGIARRRAAVARPGGAARWWGWVARAAVAVAFTLTLVQFSLRYGRLSLFPTNDDVVYLADGAVRLRHFYEGGVPVVVHEFRADPPHSPYSTYEAFGSFMVFGLHDWAPYVGNAVLVFGFLTLAAWAGRGLRWWHRACLAAFLLSVPLTGHAVSDCRPDVAAALLTTAGAFVLLGRPLAHSRPGHKAAAGVLFGLALVAKPSVFPVTLFMAANAFLAAAVADRFGRGARFTFRGLARAWLWCAVPLALVAAPYYVDGWRPTVRYVWDSTVGANADVWRRPMPLAHRVGFYLIGPGGKEMLGAHERAHAWLLAAVLVAAAAFYAVRWARGRGRPPGQPRAGPRRRREWVVAGAFAWVVLAAYVLCTVNLIKSVYLGLGFQVALVFLALLGLRNMVLSQRLRGQVPWAEALLVGFTVTAVLWFHWPGPPETRHTPASARDKRAVVEGVYDAVRRARHDGPGPPPRVLLTAYGELTSAVLNYWSVIRREPAVYSDFGMTASPGPIVEAFDAADFVVACDPGFNDGLAESDRGLVATIVPSTHFQDQILAALRARPDFVPAAAIEYPPNGRHVYVFRRVRPGAPATRPAGE